MTAIQPNPLNLTLSTKLPPPTHKRNFSRSRSPSRSPARKAQFAAQELDPLLKNLSPDSTLEALQEADAVRGTPAEQNAIARSISDASESERELGIRAAVAAKKLREWTDEVRAWPWPSSQDRAWGAGFIPLAPKEHGQIYLGSLPEEAVSQHEERLDEIWDAIETLGIDEIKDYVFSSHHPTPSREATSPTSYGRMRDFTALITATVIQSLPLLANLQISLETWSIRLTILRQIPDLLTGLEQVKLGLGAINEILHDESRSRKLNQQELETGKVMFGNRVSNLGKRVDNLLDMLEGQEDSLPQAWIDSLENIEHKYAQWVSQAEQVVLRNQMAPITPTKSASRPVTPGTNAANIPLATKLSDSPNSKLQQAPSSTSVPKAVSNPPSQQSSIKRKPLLEVNPKAAQAHKRGVSEVSVADSMMSGYSDNAEIMDAHATPVLPSPRISVIHNEFPFGKNATSWMTSPNKQKEPASPQRPFVVQRASTTSMEVVPKENIREVMFRRSSSYDMLTRRSSHSSLQQSVVAPSNAASPSYEADNPILRLTKDSMTPLAESPTPSLRVNPLSVRGKQIQEHRLRAPPLVPRRSSKRLSMPLLEAPNIFTEPSTEENHDIPIPAVGAFPQEPTTPSKDVHRAQTFDDKLKTILASMPTKFKLTEGSSSDSSEVSSDTSSRASSPTRILRLSPVKDGKSNSSNNTSGVRVYHLRGGKSRDAPPLKLFVRAVGENGDRVMVRVGGGWADLAEYLREYSLHHGGRGLADRKLEVAGFPGLQPQHKSSNSNIGSSRTTKEATPSDPGFDFGLNRNPSPKSAEENELENNPWRPPPMPIVPHGYNIPLARSTSPTHGQSVQPVQRSTPTPSARPISRVSVMTTTTPSVTTTTTSNNSYTPLGGAGPVQNNRRAAPQNQAWVEGMMNQARAASGSQAASYHSHQPHNVARAFTPTSTGTTISSTPTTTTTTIVSSKLRKSASNNAARRVSSWSTTPTQMTNNNYVRPSPITTATPTPTTTTNNSVRPSTDTTPQRSQLSRESSGSSASYATADTMSYLQRPKTRMSLGDVSGGIRRVFLRKQSQK